jgi:membrane protein DedA with SNARE-associated domain
MGIVDIAALILTYRYWILIPLTLVEGPVVAFFAGTLAAAGYFDPFILAAVFFVREAVMDGFYYALGYYGIKRAFVARLLEKIGVHDGHIEEVRSLWTKHPFKTMFLSKIAYGVAASLIVLAGAVHMRLSLFYTYALTVAVIQYGALLLLGYFYGASMGGNIINIVENLQYAIAAIGIIALIAYFGRRAANRELTKHSHEQ